jgi:hypothetical protein
VVGADPEGEDVHEEAAQQFALPADHLDPQELLPQLVLVQEEIEGVANLPLHGGGVT